MDASQLQGPRGPRPPYPRASSRSSTSTINTRMTSQSANSLTSVSTSPQLSNSHPTHRFHHASCPKPSGSPRLTPRHTPQLSREGSMESARATAVSAFLQEKLQSQRRAEGERMGHSASLTRINTDMSGSLEFGRALDSPMRTGSTDSPRPRSSAGGSAGAEPTKKPGLGLMEMEQVVSKLHKQNFDLKLELYHRREKQTSLEAQVETLENEKRQFEEINDNLLEELDKRDKAVEEAVAMIVMLEAKVEQLIIERNMVQQIEREGFFCAQDFEAKYDDQIPEISIPEPSELQEDGKSINRMPSFLSEKTENTENLRNVYLGVRGSVISLSRVVEGSPEPENGLANGLASPTLSVLSESSFMSVYGKKDHEDGYPPPIDKPLSLDGVDSNPPEPSSDEFQNMARGKPAVLPVRAATANPFIRGSSSGPFFSMHGLMDHDHPQQLMGRPERPSTTKVDGRRGPQPPPLHIPPIRKPNKDDKKESWSKAMTDAPGGVRLHDQAFPPTPDTISTSTLHHMRSSNDSLARPDHSAGGYQEESDAHKGHRHQKSGASLVERPLPVPGHGAVRDLRNGDIYTRHGDMIQRPRSASETTVSHRQGSDWHGDKADSDDESDTRSLQSSLDIWMRESTKPARNTGRVSPDLFGFPVSTTKGTWAPQAMFGPNSVRPGPQGIGPDAAYMHDLFSLRQALFAANVGPAPPDRRSSLQTTLSQPSQETDQKSRHSRGPSETIQARSTLQTPIQLTSAMPPPDKKNHYPPIVGQQGGARSGLNRLFRRSIGGTSSSGAPESIPSSVTGSPFSDTTKMTPNMGAPSWVNRAVVDDDDDRSGATPPPIMLNPRQVRRNTAGAEIMPDYLHQAANAKEQVAEICESGRQTPTSQKQQQPMTPTTPSGTGMRRKWLPAFARTSNLKNKAS